MSYLALLARLAGGQYGAGRPAHPLPHGGAVMPHASEVQVDAEPWDAQTGRPAASSVRLATDHAVEQARRADPGDSWHIRAAQQPDESIASAPDGPVWPADHSASDPIRSDRRENTRHAPTRPPVPEEAGRAETAPIPVGEVEDTSRPSAELHLSGSWPAPDSFSPRIPEGQFAPAPYPTRDQATDLAWIHPDALNAEAAQQAATSAIAASTRIPLPDPSRQRGEMPTAAPRPDAGEGRNDGLHVGEISITLRPPADAPGNRPAPRPASTGISQSAALRRAGIRRL